MLLLKQRLPFADNPRFAELELDRILGNNVVLPGEFNPHNVRLWVIGNEFGAMGAVWADCQGDALDELVDADLGSGLLIDESDADEETSRLGNAGEPADLSHAWMGEVELLEPRDAALLAHFKMLRGDESPTVNPDAGEPAENNWNDWMESEV